MKVAYFSLLLAFLIPNIVFAESKVISHTHTYTLGDNDSKRDGRAICFLEAKRMLIEKAGVLIRSHTQVESGTLNKDEINSYTAALVKVQNAEERWSLSNSGSMTVTMKVRAVLDTDDIQSRLQEIQQNSTYKDDLLKHQKRVEALERQIEEMQAKLDNANLYDAAELRKERVTAFGGIEGKPRPPRVPDGEFKPKKFPPEMRHIGPGDPKAKVFALLGRPHRLIPDRKGRTRPCLSYGRFSIRIDRESPTRHVLGVYDGPDCRGPRIR